MPADQKEIYYLLAPNREAAEGSPYFEVFKSRRLETLFLYDPWDEFVMEHLHSFDGKDLRSAEKAELSVEDTAAPEGALSAETADALGKWLKDKLGERVGQVRPSKRLVDSPAVVVESDKMLTSSMRRILKAMKREDDAAAAGTQDLEINPRHPIVIRLEAIRRSDDALAAKVAEQVLDNARMAAGLLEDPRAMLRRLNELLEQVLAAKQ